MGVLLVEGSPAVRETMKDFLERALPVEVVGVPGRDAAPAALQARAFDLAIVEMGPDPHDGLALLEQIAQDHPRTLRVLLTASTEPRLAAQACAGAGVHGHIQKPYSRKRVASLVGRLLRERQRGPRRLREQDLLEAMARARYAGVPRGQARVPEDLDGLGEPSGEGEGRNLQGPAPG